MNVTEVENQRLLALQRYGLLDTPAEEIFDGITRAIASICDVPIALLSLVDADRQWFKSAVGLEVTETPRDIAFCDHAISRPDDLMVVEDASVDQRFQRNPLVTADPSIRFYAGKPIITHDGYALGTLCVIDHKPRVLETHQIEALEALSATVSAILDERQRLRKVAIDRNNAEELARRNAIEFQQSSIQTKSLLDELLQQFPAAAVVVNRVGEIVTLNDQWNEFSDSNGWARSNAGDNYLETGECCESLFGSQSNPVPGGLSEILSGKRSRSQFVYSTGKMNGSIEITGFAQGSQGAMIQHRKTMKNTA